ncbi:substrate-binding domain-containing protein [Lutimaribacter marinistellae]|uniref:Substrate-binding domain-containing protein n=1 Tax=Lutimaribacter marinistellae TaxID=1820329 RepID=A0ABV7TK96_9RHOB
MLVKILGTVAFSLLLAGTATAQDKSIIVQSTTSTANSGLYDHILPLFEQKTGIRVNVVAVGTGQAIRNARNCDGDLLLVHAKSAEEAFVAEGFGTARTDLMYNDFILVGPEADPASIDGMDEAAAALARISESEALFASRGDDSGTHKKEVALWTRAGIDPTKASGTWYRETGSGMGATLNAAIGMGAYAMTDRATWISFANKQDYAIRVEGDSDLFNQYGVIPVNPKKCPNVNAEAALTFADWLMSDEGQGAIASHEVGGQQLFFPNAPQE